MICANKIDLEPHISEQDLIRGTQSVVLCCSDCLFMLLPRRTEPGLHHGQPVGGSAYFSAATGEHRPRAGVAHPAVIVVAQMAACFRFLRVASVILRPRLKVNISAPISCDK